MNHPYLVLFPRQTTISVENHKFPHPMNLMHLLRGSPWNFVMAVALKKTSVMSLPDDDMCISSETIWYHSVTDGQMDGQIC